MRVCELVLVLLACCCSLSLAYRPQLHRHDNDTEQACPGRPAFSKVVLCYYEGRAPVSELDPCLCSHLVFTNAARFPQASSSRAPIAPITLDSGLVLAVQSLRKRNPELRLLGRVSGGARTALINSRGAEVAASLARMARSVGLDGLEVALNWDGARVAGGAQGKQRLVALVKGLRSALIVASNQGGRVKRSYSVHEELVDDIPRPTWISGLYIRPNGSVGVTTTSTTTSSPEVISNNKPVGQVEKEPLLLLQVSAKPGVLGKRFDLKPLSKYVDFFTVPTYNMTDDSEFGMTYHHSRLMGLSDILNTDSVLDLLTGLGAPASRIIVTLPAVAQRFELSDSTVNKPRSPAVAPPTVISHQQVCSLLSEGGWMVERDEDLTAPYAFRNQSWIAFDDELSVEIKGKYALLRGLAGVGVWSIDNDDLNNVCGRGRSGLTRALASTFVTLARRTRSAVLQSLVEPLAAANSPLLVPVNTATISPYRIVRVVDRTGTVQVVRRDAQNEYECSRQGYYRHPLGCDRFYRCVKFDQRSDDYSVFEYDCPPGLAFDERWEVCVWPGQARAPCDGTSEIRPVPRSKFACSAPGYYADPENCRWFFACMDHRRDGSQLTPYEFRCPYGLGFDEQNLMCNWPWMVPNCGGAGISGQITGLAVDQVIRGGYSKQNSGALPVVNTYNTNAYQDNIGAVVQPILPPQSRPVITNVRPQIIPITKVTPNAAPSVYEELHDTNINNGYPSTGPTFNIAPINTGNRDIGSGQQVFVPTGVNNNFNRPQFVNTVSASGPSSTGIDFTNNFPNVQVNYDNIENVNENEGVKVEQTYSTINSQPQFIDNAPINVVRQFDRTVSQIQNAGVRAQPVAPIVLNSNTRVASNFLTQNSASGYQSPQFVAQNQYVSPTPATTGVDYDVTAVTQNSVFDSQKIDFGTRRPASEFTSSDEFGSNQPADVNTYSNFQQQGATFTGNSQLGQTPSRTYLPQKSNSNTPRPNIISSEFFEAGNNDNRNAQSPLNNNGFTVPSSAGILPTQNSVYDQDLDLGRPTTQSTLFNSNLGPTGILPTVNSIFDDSLSPVQNSYGSPIAQSGIRRPEYGTRITQSQKNNGNQGIDLNPNRVRPQQNSVTILSPDAPTSDLGQIDFPDVSDDVLVNSVSTTPASGFTIRPTVRGRPSISNIILTANPVNDDDDESATDAPSSTRAPSSTTTQKLDVTTYGTRTGTIRGNNDDTVQSLLDTYSGRFSGFFDNNNEQFIQDVIANRNRGNNNNGRTRQQNDNYNQQTTPQNFNSQRDRGSTTQNSVDYNQYDVSSPSSFDTYGPSTTVQPSQDEFNIGFINNGQFFAHQNQPSSTTPNSFESTSNNLGNSGNFRPTPASRSRTAAELNNFNNRFIDDTQENAGKFDSNTRNNQGTRQGNTAAELNNFNNRFIGDESSTERDVGDVSINFPTRQGTRQGNTAAELNNFNNRFIDDESNTQQSVDDFGTSAPNTRQGTRQGNTAAELNNFNNRFIEEPTTTPQSIDEFTTLGRHGKRPGNSAAELNSFNNRFIGGQPTTVQSVDTIRSNPRGRQGTRQGNTAAELNNFNNRFIDDESSTQQSEDNFGDDVRGRQGTRPGSSAAELNNFNNRFIDEPSSTPQSADRFGSNSRNRQGTRQGNTAAELNNFNNRRINDQRFLPSIQQNTRSNEFISREQESVTVASRGSVKFGARTEQDASSTIQNSQVGNRRNGVTVISRPATVNAIPLVEKLEGTTGEGLGRKFDRYGPGGWRSANETLGPEACQREGLFRHPNDCNKFYECFYDSWKDRYTIHIFNCPIRLAYDPTISACNWPIDGPGCSGNRLLLHV